MEKKNLVGILCALGGSGLINDAIQVLIYMNKLANNLYINFDLIFEDISNAYEPKSPKSVELPS